MVWKTLSEFLAGASSAYFEGSSNLVSVSGSGSNAKNNFIQEVVEVGGVLPLGADPQVI